MTDIPEELVERVAKVIWRGPYSDIPADELVAVARSAIRAVFDWQAKEWVEIPRLDRP